MTNPFRSPAGATRALGLSVFFAVIAACDPFPDGGYEKVAERDRESLAEADAPPPPRYVAGIGAGPTTVPTLGPGAPAGVTQAMVELGAEQYATVCTACHGAAGVGSPAAPALNDADWIHITGNFDELVGIINSGVAQPQQYPGMMPPRGGGPFNDEQIRAIAAYVYALSHAQGS